MLARLIKLLHPDPRRRDTLGDRGENAAAKFLRKLGYKILLRNYRCPLGEIDIIARDGTTLVFVEVKTRTDDRVMPEEQVNSFKQHQLTKAGYYYLNRYGASAPAARFDVIAVEWPSGSEPQIRHSIDAFAATF